MESKNFAQQEACMYWIFFLMCAPGIAFFLSHLRIVLTQGVEKPDGAEKAQIFAPAAELKVEGSTTGKFANGYDLEECQGIRETDANRMQQQRRRLGEAQAGFHHGNSVDFGQTGRLLEQSNLESGKMNENLQGDKYDDAISGTLQGQIEAVAQSMCVQASQDLFTCLSSDPACQDLHETVLSRTRQEAIVGSELIENDGLQSIVRSQNRRAGDGDQSEHDSVTKVTQVDIDSAGTTVSARMGEDSAQLRAGAQRRGVAAGPVPMIRALTSRTGDESQVGDPSGNSMWQKSVESCGLDVEDQHSRVAATASMCAASEARSEEQRAPATESRTMETDAVVTPDTCLSSRTSEAEESRTSPGIGQETSMSPGTCEGVAAEGKDGGWVVDLCIADTCPSCGALLNDSDIRRQGCFFDHVSFSERADGSESAGKEEIMIACAYCLCLVAQGCGKDGGYILQEISCTRWSLVSHLCKIAACAIKPRILNGDNYLSVESENKQKIIKFEANCLFIKTLTHDAD
jgi:hypothetical protein